MKWHWKAAIMLLMMFSLADGIHLFITRGKIHLLERALDDAGIARHK